MSELNWTGERLVTQIADKQGTIEHLHRYALAMQIVKDKVVLDIASGEGYGSNLLSFNAQKVYGVDIFDEAVIHANGKYKKHNLNFITGSTSDIPLGNASVDVVVSFETIEHHDEHQKMMTEIKRVLKPGGILIISSPEKNNYKFREENNPYHIKELTFNEFDGLIKENFSYYKIYTQRFVYGSIITKQRDLDQSNGFNFFTGDYTGIQNNIHDVKDQYADAIHNRAYFNIAIASDTDIRSLTFGDTSFFDAIEIFHKQIESIRNSYSFKVGSAIVKPLSVIKSFMRKFKR